MITQSKNHRIQTRACVLCWQDHHGDGTAIIVGTAVSAAAQSLERMPWMSQNKTLSPLQSIHYLNKSLEIKFVLFLIQYEGTS